MKLENLRHTELRVSRNHRTTSLTRIFFRLFAVSYENLQQRTKKNKTLLFKKSPNQVHIFLSAYIFETLTFYFSTIGKTERSYRCLYSRGFEYLRNGFGKRIKAEFLKSFPRTEKILKDYI